MGSGLGVQAPQKSASSTTSARVTSPPRKVSRMYGCVWTWSSQSPRPQNRQAPIAVRLQCQQSMWLVLSQRWPAPRNGLVMERSVGRLAWVKGASLEGAGNELVETLTIQPVRPGQRGRTDGGRPGAIGQEGDLSEIRSGAEP